ncbi:MAG: FAD-dependent oxidoreductase [Steroidobacteraceae bacterium]
MSYWLDTAPPFKSATDGPPDGDADVAVVGAGFTGLSAALALARKGAKVVVLEAGAIAGEARDAMAACATTASLQGFSHGLRRRSASSAPPRRIAFDAGVVKVEQIVTEEA